MRRRAGPEASGARAGPRRATQDDGVDLGRAAVEQGRDERRAAAVRALASGVHSTWQRVKPAGSSGGRSAQWRRGAVASGGAARQSSSGAGAGRKQS
jgi:hypothetical protein